MTANKRKALCLVLCGLLALPGFLPAHGETGKLGKWEVHYAREVDLTGLVTANGRITGTVDSFRPKAAPRVLRVDCPIPEDFTREQQASLTVEYRSFSKKELTAALYAAGTDPGPGKIILSRGKDQYCAIYRAEDLLNPFFISHRKSELSQTGPAVSTDKAPQMDAARTAALAFLRTLGVEPYEAGLSVSRLYDPKTYGLDPQRSDSLELQAEANREYMRYRKKLNRTDFNYTVVSAAVMLQNLPAFDQFSWPAGDSREPDARMGDVIWASLAVQDNGPIAEVSLNNVPALKSAQPLKKPLHTWQEALKEFIASYWTDRANPTDTPIKDTQRGREATAYATYTVLTQVTPVYMSTEKNTYTPAWCFVFTRRTVRDDAFVSMEAYCLDAVTLTNPSLLAFK